jgi:hypothetical protein
VQEAAQLLQRGLDDLGVLSLQRTQAPGSRQQQGFRSVALCVWLPSSFDCPHVYTQIRAGLRCWPQSARHQFFFLQLPRSCPRKLPGTFLSFLQLPQLEGS